jgi:hypothetical protein
MDARHCFRWLWALPALATLAGCGGGGDGASVAPAFAAPSCAAPPQTLPVAPGAAAIGGTIARDIDPSFILVSAGDDKRLVLFYGPDLAAESTVNGMLLVRTDWRSSCWGAIATNAEELGPGRPESHQYAYLYAGLSPAVPVVDGTIRYVDASYSFSGGPIPGSTYDATAPAQIAEVVGDWTMRGLWGEAVTMQIDASGTLRGTMAGAGSPICPAFTGSVTPGTQGLNLLRLRIECSGTVLPGFALAMPLAAGGMQLLVFAESEGGFGTVFFMAIGRR